MGKLLGMWGYINERLGEPSTHASIASLIALAGYNLDAGIVHDTFVSLGLGFGALGFFVKESKAL